LVFPGARIGERCLVRRSIVGPGVVLPDGAAVEARLVTVQQTRQSPGPADSVVGDLVFTPIGG
jgi:hypothetical protein